MASWTVGGKAGVMPWVKIASSVLVAATVVALVFAQRGVLVSGLSRLGGADPRWLVPAAFSAVLLWLASALSQAGAVGSRLPFPALCAVQAAASFADHFLPGGSGGFLVNVRFLRRQGLTGPEAATSVVLRSVVGWCVRLPLLAAVLIWQPQYVLPLGRRIPNGPAEIGIAVALAAAIAVLLVLARHRCRSGAPRWFTDLRVGLAVLRTPGKAAALWLGALIAPLLHALVLFAVAQAMHVDLSWVHVLVLYLVVSTLTGILPIPGVVGALEVVLVAALIAAGVPGADAAGTTVAYRMITVWLPLLPAGVLLALLVRRNVV
jgi:uncharacterized membrane protein YbhN (UPF0104 family)